MSRLKTGLANAALVLMSTAFNFAVFIFAYNRLAFPYLHEAQRMENAPLIFGYALPAFLLISIIILGGAYILGRSKALGWMFR